MKKGSFTQIPYWKLRGLYRSKGYLDREVAEEIGITQKLMSQRMQGSAPWTSNEIGAICKLMEIRQEMVGMYFFPDLPMEQNH